MTQVADTRADHGVTTLPVVFTGGRRIVADRVIDTWTVPAAERAATGDLPARLGADECAVCVIPFSPDAETVVHRVALASREPAVTRSVDHDHVVTEDPSPRRYLAGVREALDRIAAGELDKAVLGRCLDVVSRPPLTAEEILGRLLTTRPGRHVFSVPLTRDVVSGPALVGASPELLVRRRGGEVGCLPLAGSAPRSGDPDEDARRAEQLLASRKDRVEHAYVVDQIVAALRQVALEVRADPEPRLLATDALWHLATSIDAHLPAGSGPSALDLAWLLHPTPAVGGVPRDRALSAIAAIEGPGLRGPLAGAVGWVDGSGDGEFAVSIRAGVLHGDRLRIFAGAGIVAGSDPETEVAETSAKLATMSRVVGL